MLHLNKISSGYDQREIIHDVTFSAGPGQIVGLVGSNGSGKSTLLKTILGLIKVRQGQVTWSDKNLHNMSAPERAQIVSLLESQPTVEFSMSVRELLQVANRNLSPTEQNELLQLVDLANHADSDCLTLSSGELKRAFIAHTLASQAKVILLDEPFAQLDWPHQRKLAAIMTSWAREKNTTFVVAAHELQWILQIATQACVLKNGRIIAAGKPDEIFAQKHFCDLFDFQTLIDENPIDGSRRLTIGKNEQQT